MSDKERIITDLRESLDSVDITSDLRLVLIHAIEYLQREPSCEKKDYCERYEKLTQSDTFKSSYCDKSLGKEESTSDDLEEAAEKYSDNASNIIEWSNGWEDLNDCEYVERAFKAGSKWQKQKDQESSCDVNYTTKSDDLEEAAFKYRCEHKSCDAYTIDAFKAGAEWQKQKDQQTIELAEDHAMLAGMMKEREEMMKNAVDAFVHQGLYSKYVKECDGEALANVLKNHNSGDKVKIIIVNEE